MILHKKTTHIYFKRILPKTPLSPNIIKTLFLHHKIKVSNIMGGKAYSNCEQPFTLTKL